MRIATFNVNGLRSRLDFLVHWLRARQPDVVGLQELKLSDEQFPHLELAAEGYKAIIHGQKSWNGVAILSREPAELIYQGLPGFEADGSRVLCARIGDLTFSSVYCPNGKSVAHEDFPKKLRWYDALIEHVRGNHDPNHREVIVGDFNIVPAPIDSWNESLLGGRIFHTPEERARLAALLELGFFDLFRQKYPDTVAFSWWDYRAGAFHKKQGLRIDLILGTRAVLERTESVEIDREYRKKKDGLIASDHAPVLADLA